MKKLQKKLPPKKEIKKELARRKLLRFTKYTFPQYQENWHHKILAQQLDEVLKGNISRLMVFMPPRYGKTELASRRFPSYALGRNPDTRVIACSYGKTLASDINRDCQKIITSPEYRALFPDTTLYSGKSGVTRGMYTRNSEVFEIVNHRGFYKSAGVGGGITGKGFDIGIIDDPIKNYEEAMSLTYRKKVWDWYTSTFYTRKEKGAVIILIMTHWHEDDLAGRLLKQDKKSVFAEDWKVINFPAIKMEENSNDPRSIGEPLWPDKYSKENLEVTKETVGKRKWKSLYQQKPRTDEEGALWNYDMFKYIQDVPSLKRVEISIDPAGTANPESDETGIIVAGIDYSGYGYVLRDSTVRASPNGWASAAIRDYKQFEGDLIIGEVNQGGDMVENTIKTVDDTVPFKQVRASRGKALRAEPVAALYEQGKVFHVNGLDKLETQLTSWDSATTDDSPDRLDALVYVLTSLMLGDRKKKAGIWGRR